MHQKHYTGFTSNLAQRLLSHNELGKDWTASYRPWQLIFTKEFNFKKEAPEYEKWLKTGAGGGFIKNINSLIIWIHIRRGGRKFIPIAIGTPRYARTNSFIKRLGLIYN